MRSKIFISGAGLINKLKAYSFQIIDYIYAFLWIKFLFSVCFLLWKGPEITGLLIKIYFKMPQRGTKSAAMTREKMFNALNDEDGPDTEVEFFLRIYKPLLGIIAGK